MKFSAFAKKHDAHLVIIESKEENDFISKFPITDFTLIGVMQRNFKKSEE